MLPGASLSPKKMDTFGHLDNCSPSSQNLNLLSSPLSSAPPTNDWGKKGAGPYSSKPQWATYSPSGWFKERLPEGFWGRGFSLAGGRKRLLYTGVAPAAGSCFPNKSRSGPGWSWHWVPELKRWGKSGTWGHYEAAGPLPKPSQPLNCLKCQDV